MPEAEELDQNLDEFRQKGKETFEETMNALTKRRTNTMAPLFKDVDMASNLNGSTSSNEQSNGSQATASTRGVRAGRGGRGGRTANTNTRTAQTAATSRANSRSTRAAQPTLVETMARSSQRSTNRKVSYID